MKVKAQTGIPGKIAHTFVQVRDNHSNDKAPVKRPCLLWLPKGYSDSSSLPFYPLLVYVHDKAEGGNLNGNELNKLKMNGPFYFLQTKKWDGSAPGGGECGQSSFFVFAMQGYRGSTIDINELSYAISQLLMRFRIDETRIIFTGYSHGAETVLRYLFNPKIPNQPKLAVLTSVLTTFTHRELPNVVRRQTKLWAFSFDKDTERGVDFRSVTAKLVDEFNKTLPNSAKLTITAGRHCCWNKYYDPGFRETDQSTGEAINIYEWMMKNIAWGNAGPPIYKCDDYVITPNKLAGYVSLPKKNKKEITLTTCITPVYTIDGKIRKGSLIYVQRSGETMPGNNLHFGYSTVQLRGSAPNRRLVIDPDGVVVTIDELR